MITIRQRLLGLGLGCYNYYKVHNVMAMIGLKVKLTLNFDLWSPGPITRKTYDNIIILL